MSSKHQIVQNVSLIKVRSSNSLIEEQSLQNKQCMKKLANLLNCNLCNNRVNNAHLCPKCSKFYCQHCIKEWLRDGHNQCPNCHDFLRLPMIVNCSQLVEQIRKIQEESRQQLNNFNLFNEENACNLNNNFNAQQNPSQNQNNCSQHQMKIQYFCLTCKVNLCSDCAILQSKHKLHSLDKLSNQKIKLLAHLNELQKNLTIKKSQIQTYRHIQEDKKQQIRLNNNKNYQLLEKHDRSLSEKINKKFNEHIDCQSKQLQLHQSKYNQFKIQFQQLQTFITKSSKVQLIEQYDLNQIKSEKLLSFKIQNSTSIIGASKQSSNNFELIDLKKINLQYENQLNPQYEHKTFVLNNYSYLRGKKDVLYSQALFWRQMEWRLKIYPNGLTNNTFGNNHESNAGCLAIYLQMSKSNIIAKTMGSYRFKIELINQIDRRKKISREFQSEFEEKGCWGYDNFAKISTLYQQNYLNEKDDVLEIVLYIKSPTYYHTVEEQKHRIRQKSNKIVQNHKLIEQLKLKIQNKTDKKILSTKKYTTYQNKLNQQNKYKQYS